MSIINNSIIAGASGQAGGVYEIERSLRFDRVASSYIEAPTLTSGKDTYTISLWIKRTEFVDYYAIYSTGTTSSGLFFDNSNGVSPSAFYSYFNSVGGTTSYTNELHRDPSAWYHIVVSVNSSIPTIYVNGVVQTKKVGQSDPNFGTLTDKLYFGIYSDSLQYPFDGYMADIYFIDGQALDETDFGKFDDNGVWQPIKYAGTYGSEGFHLPLSDPGSVSALGRDDSGNDNHCTLYNITPLGQVSPESDVITAVNTNPSAFGASGSYPGLGQVFIFDKGTTILNQSNPTVDKLQQLNAFPEIWSPQNPNTYVNGTNIAAQIEVSTSSSISVTCVESTPFKILTASIYAGGGAYSYTISGDVSVSGTTGGSAGRYSQTRDEVTVTPNFAGATFTITTNSSNRFYIQYIPIGGETVLTFASNQNLTKFSSGDFVRQDSGGTPSSPSSWTVKTGIQSTNYLNATLGTRGLRAVERLPQQGVLFVDTSLLPVGWSLNITPLGTPLYIRTVTSDQGAGMTFSSANAWNYEGISTEMQFNASTSGLSRYIIISHLIAGPIDFLFASDFGLPVGNVASTDTSANTMTIGDSTNTWSANTSNYVIGPYTLSSTPSVDSLLDSPTNGDTADDTGAGGEMPGNYCTWNPLNKGANMVLLNGNLDIATTTGTSAVTGTIGVSSGKWYWEMTITGANDRTAIGIAKAGMDLTDMPGDVDALGWSYYADGGTKRHNATSTAYGASFTNGDTVAAALDLDAGTITFYKNGVSQGTAFTGLSGEFFPAAGDGSGVNNANSSTNFGQRPFAYQAPSGFRPLATPFLDDPTIEDGSTAMDVVTYTGNSSNQTISGLGFSPDLVWIKNRVDAANHRLYDTIRGASNELIPDLTLGEATDTEGLNAFTSDGFSVGIRNPVNGNGDGIVAWTWDAGASTVANTDGSISSSVRANASAGFSIVEFGSSSGTQSIGHGLGVTPSMIICRKTDQTYNWIVHHKAYALGSYLQLNTTAALQSYPFFGTNAPTSTTFEWIDCTTTQIAYCFAPVEGYSAFGSYTGNGDPNGNGPFVYTGHRSRWLMIKRTDSTGNWVMLDTARNSYNPAETSIYADDPAGDYTPGQDWADIFSNGFKVRASYGEVNALGGTYVFASFAENPFSIARAR